MNIPYFKLLQMRPRDNAIERTRIALVSTQKGPRDLQQEDIKPSRFGLSTVA